MIFLPFSSSKKKSVERNKSSQTCLLPHDFFEQPISKKYLKQAGTIFMLPTLDSLKLCIFVFCHRGLAFARQNDSNLGSVKSTVSSSEARQLLAFEVKRINLSI